MEPLQGRLHKFHGEIEVSLHRIEVTVLPDDVQLDIGMKGVKPPEARNEPSECERRTSTQPNVYLRLPWRYENLRRIFQLPQHTANHLRELLTVIGKLDLSGQPEEQFATEPLLQALDVLTNGALSDAEFRRGPGETFVAGGRLEKTKSGEGCGVEATHC